MDWLSLDNLYLVLNDERSSIFKFGKKSEHGCQVLRQYAPNLELKTARDDAWKEWLDNDNVFKLDSGNPTPSGFCVLVCGRAKPIKQRPAPLPAELFHLPISFKVFKKVTDSFHVHDLVQKAMLQKTTYASIITKEKGPETLDMYTAVIGSLNPQNIAVSSTHFKEARLTVAVLYGCNSQQMEKAQELLEGCGRAKNHPLLVIGTFTELQRDGLDDLVEETIDECVELSSDLQVDHTNVKRMSSLIFHFNKTIRKLRLRIKQLENEVKLTQSHLKTLIQHAEDMLAKKEDSTSKDQSDFNEVTMRFKKRFDEINREYDDMIAKCLVTSEEMSYNAELFRAELSRLEAKASSREAKLSTALAFVAMLYLPMTTVATIFAMPIFDFKNEWRYWDYKLAEANSSGSAGESPVFSGYFWIYLGVSIGMTAVTVVVWKWYTGLDFKDSETLKDSETQSSIQGFEKGDEAGMNDSETESDDDSASDGTHPTVDATSVSGDNGGEPHQSDAAKRWDIFRKKLPQHNSQDKETALVRAEESRVAPANSNPGASNIGLESVREEEPRATTEPLAEDPVLARQKSETESLPPHQRV